MIKAVEALKNSGKVMVDENHDWGYQLRFVNKDEYCCKFLVLTSSDKGSKHFHKNKKETFIVLQGILLLEMDLDGKWMKSCDMITLDPGTRHQMQAIEVPTVILEVSTHDDDSDTYRIGGKDND